MDKLDFKFSDWYLSFLSDVFILWWFIFSNFLPFSPIFSPQMRLSGRQKMTPTIASLMMQKIRSLYSYNKLPNFLPIFSHFLSFSPIFSPQMRLNGPLRTMLIIVFPDDAKDLITLFLQQNQLPHFLQFSLIFSLFLQFSLQMRLITAYQTMQKIWSIYSYNKIKSSHFLQFSLIFSHFLSFSPIFSYFLSLDEIEWPPEDDADYCIPDDAKDLITLLLQQNPIDRLGTGGSHEVHVSYFLSFSLIFSSRYSYNKTQSTGLVLVEFMRYMSHIFSHFL